MWGLILSVLDHCLSFYFGIENGRNSFINNRVMSFDLCKNMCFSSISSERMDELFINFVYALIYGPPVDKRDLTTKSEILKVCIC